MAAAPSLAARLLDRALAGLLRGVASVVPRIPTRASLRIADGLALAFYVLNTRGRRAGRENLRAVFGGELPTRERRRILRGSYRTLMRSVWALTHLRPLPPERYARWVRLAPEDEARMRRAVSDVGYGVIVSGHFGNWELLLASRTGLGFAPRFRYLAEATLPALDAVLDEARDRGGGRGVLRKGGALAMKRALDEGQSVGILVDRNVRGDQGGVYVPFLGLPARTTPLPALLARRYGKPLCVMLCVPDGPDRWRLWMSPNLMDAPTEDEDADVQRALGRANDVLSEAIRRQPEAWLWMIKRWKSRPTAERGRYPAYSYPDPDPA